MAKKLTALVICTSLLTGCVPTYTIDDVNLAQGVAYNAVPGGKVKGTVAFPGYGRGEQTTDIKNVTMSAVAKTSEGIKSLINNESPKPIKSGQLLIALYSQELASRGIYELIDSLRRDPEIGRLLNLAVTKGKADRVLKFKYVGGLTPPMFISALIKQNSERNVPKTNLHTFLYSYYGKGMDPFLPLLEKKGDHVQIIGLALFDDDRFVGSIPNEKFFVFTMMYQQHKNGTYEVTVEKKDAQVAVNSIKSSLDFKVTGGLNSPKITLNIRMTGVVDEAGKLHIKNKKDITLVEKNMKKELEKSAEKLIGRFQEKGVDPLGLGDRVRSFYRGWTEKKWDSIYPDVQVQVNVDVNIVQTGVVR